MNRTRARHACADYMYDQWRWQTGDTIVCSCGKRYTLCLRSETRAFARWRGIGSCLGAEHIWVRNRKAERAARREQTLRAREWNRG